jgi:regulator of protease activity HflC (stomatin/prohibitin superfamily)
MNIVLLVIGVVAAILGIIIRILTKDTGYVKLGKHYAHPMIIGGLILLVFSQSFAIIPTGYTGVRITFGQIDNRTVQNGFNWKIPFVQSINQVNNKQQDISYTGQVWSETAERTVLYYEGITVTYTINPEKSAWIYANVSDYKKNLISDNLVASAIKSSSKELNSTDATNRGIIEPIAQEKIQEALDQKYGPDVVFINKVVIANTDFEESYNQAIADKQTAQLAYEKQQIENKRQIEAAEADAQVKTTQAKAEADAAVIKAQGEADANKLLNDSITEKILKQQYYEKWDGKLPSVMNSDSSDLILDIGNVTDGATTAE